MNKKFIKFVFYCLVCICFLGVLFRPVRRVEVFFSPSFDCEANIINAILNTERTLDIAVFSMTNRIAKAAILQKAGQTLSFPTGFPITKLCLSEKPPDIGKM